MTYSFWALLKAQYSWHNDKKALKYVAGISMLYTTFLIIMAVSNVGLGSSIMAGSIASIIAAIISFGIVFTAVFLTLVVGFHILKILVMSLYCAVVARRASSGDVRVMGMYSRAMTWRQK